MLLIRKGSNWPKPFSDTNSIALFYSNIGVNFGMLGQLDQALAHFRTSYQLKQQVGDRDGANTARINIGRTHLEMGELDSALFYLNKARVQSVELGNEDDQSTALHFLGLVAMKQELIEVAQHYFEEVLVKYDQHEQKGKMAEILARLAEVHYLKGNYAEAASYCESGIPIVEALQLNEVRMDMYELKSSLLEKMGRYEEANQYLRRYLTLRDSFVNTQNTRKIAQMKANYELEKKESENQVLRLENERQKAQARSNRYLALIFAALSLLIATLLFFRYRTYLSQKRSRLELENTVRERTEELRKINEQLTNTNQELKSFSYIASHDLKEPLRSISGFTSLLERRLRPHLDEETREYMRYIKKNTSHLHTLIQDVLSYSMVPNEAPLPEKVDLNALVADVKGSLHKFLQKHNGRIISDDLPFVSSNYPQLFLIFKNLVENGIKYNDKLDPSVEISHRWIGNDLEVCFADNGIGISSEFHEQIFGLFKRLHNREAYPGTGMGLALTKKIANRLRGDIRLESEVGQGSRFFIRLRDGQLSE